MNKLLVSALIVSLLFSVSLIKFNAKAGSGATGHKIIIDAGHGGSDPGTTQCDGLNESVANLQIAKLLRDKLEAHGATVYMTREDDVYMTNEQRYTMANGTDGEVLVSIHLNGSTDHSINGTLGLYANIKKDKAFANTLHKQLVSDLGVRDLGITNFMSGVILKFNGPATIQESVYLSNTEECAALKNSDGVRADGITDSLLEGLNTWFDSPVAPTKPGKNR